MQTILPSGLTRREMLWRSGGGLGGVALSWLFGQAELDGAGRPELNGGLHHRARVKRVIQLFMNGGASQIDTFDYKPELKFPVWLYGSPFASGSTTNAGRSWFRVPRP